MDQNAARMKHNKRNLEPPMKLGKDSHHDVQIVIEKTQANKFTRFLPICKYISVMSGVAVDLAIGQDISRHLGERRCIQPILPADVR
jgi:hypothetical protein